MNITRDEEKLSPNEEKIEYLTKRIRYYERNFEQLFNCSDSITYNPLTNKYYVFPCKNTTLCIEVYPEDIQLFKAAKEEYLRRKEIKDEEGKR